MSSDIILKIKDKLTRSSGFYSELVARKKRDREIFGGTFWTSEVIKATDRNERICRNFSMYAKYMNAIVSPFSKSPYHAELEDPDGIYKKIQEQIDNLENNNNVKYVFTEAVRHACIEGVGFFILSIVDGKVTVEAVRDNGHVALDPTCQELDASDCEYAAVVDYIALSKAKRLYGDGVADYEGNCILSDIGSQWTIPAQSVPIVTYYEIGSDGKVSMWKACGNKIITDEVKLEMTRVPIFRICFNEVVRNNKVDYNGIVDMTADLQFGINLAYSTLLERANRTPKANFLMPAKAIDGLEEYYRKLHTKESLVALYNGDIAPTPIIESYQTQDLLSTVQGCNDLMSSVIGVPSDGIQPFTQNQTATEILVQQANSESNVNSLYSNAYNTIFSFTKALCELYCCGNIRTA